MKKDSYWHLRSARFNLGVVIAFSVLYCKDRTMQFNLLPSFCLNKEEQKA
jgi:hypothetical protein